MVQTLRIQTNRTLYWSKVTQKASGWNGLTSLIKKGNHSKHRIRSYYRS